MRPGWMAVAVLALGCDLLPTHYSNELDVDGVALKPGALAGTWLAQLEVHTVVRMPVFGEYNAGSSSGRLVHVQWDPALQRYTMQLTWCWADIYEVAGLRQDFSDETLASIVPAELVAGADHAAGRLESERWMDLWGLRNLPEPYDTDLPDRHNYNSPPQRDWVYDEDNDGHPAVTVHMHGTINGDGYVIARNVFVLHGAARTADEVVGLVEMQKLEQRMLDSTAPILAGNQDAVETRQRPDPDPQNSWFQMVRGAADATCADVRQARSDGKLAGSRPF